MLDLPQAQSRPGAVSPTDISDPSTGLWRRACGLEWGAYSRQALDIWKGIAGLTWSTAWLAVLSLAFILFVQSFNGRTVTIEAITVPKQLQENGFTADVAAHRLRDTINDFSKMKKKTGMKDARVQLHGEDADVVVPGVGLSLDAVVATMRRFFHNDSRQVISGDLTLVGTQARLRLRFNGTMFYDSPEPVDLGQVDKLFDAAAQKIIWKIEPFLIASAAYATEPNKAFELADQIIRESSSPDEDVSWAHNLQAVIYQDDGRYEKALEAVKSAVDHPANWEVAAVARNTKGSILFSQSDELRAKAEKEQDKSKRSILLSKSDQLRAEAKQEFEAAIFYNPSYVLAYTNLGIVLHASGPQRDDAAVQIIYDLAKALPINNAMDACTLANALSDLRRNAEAREKSELAKKLAPGMVNTSSDGGIVRCTAARSDALIAIPSTSVASQLTLATSELGREPPTPNVPSTAISTRPGTSF